MNRILVPLDGSRFAEHALATAAGLARTPAVKLRLVHVLDYQRFVPLPPAPDEAWLHSTARDEARKWKADLIVMSTHGLGGIDRAWLGSVADALVRESAAPVLLVRAEERERPTTEPVVFKHVVVTLDGSTLAEQAVAPAAAIAGLHHARLSLLRVVHPWVMATRPMASAPVLPELREAAVEQRQREAMDYLNGIAASIGEQLGNVTADVIVADAADANEIIARRHDVDLIALATHGRSGLKRVVLGSVADKLIRGASVPVLVLSPAE